MSAQSFKSRWQVAFIEDTRLDVYDKALGLALSISAKADGTFSERSSMRPSVATLGRRASMHKSTVGPRLERLEALGWFDVIEWSQGRKTHHLQLAIPTRTDGLGTAVDDQSTDGGNGSNRRRSVTQPSASYRRGHVGTTSLDMVDGHTEDPLLGGVVCPGDESPTSGQHHPPQQVETSSLPSGDGGSGSRSLEPSPDVEPPSGDDILPPNHPQLRVASIEEQFAQAQADIDRLVEQVLQREPWLIRLLPGRAHERWGNFVPD